MSENDTNTTAGFRRYSDSIGAKESKYRGLRPEERDLRKRNVVQALCDGAETIAEACWVASTSAAAVRAWAELDEFFARAIEVAVEDSRDLYEDRDCGDLIARQAEEEFGHAGRML